MSKHKPTSPSGSSKAVYAVFGPELFLKDQAVRRVRAETIGRDFDPMAYSEFDAGAEPAEVFDELRTLPLLAPFRLVAIHDADAFVKKHRESLERYCASPSPSASLLLICKTFDARTRLYKTVAGVGEVIKCDSLKGMAVAQWLSQRAQAAYDKRLDRRAADLLRRQAGDDLAILDSELLKLSTYVGDRAEISAKDVAALVGLQREEKVFGIADALSSRDAATALRLWEQVWRTDRAAPGRAIAGLAWALRRDLEAKCEVDRGASPASIARKFWMSPDELIARLNRNTLAQFEDKLRALLQADAEVKTGLSDVRTTIEKFIVTQCAMARAS